MTIDIKMRLIKDDSGEWWIDYLTATSVTNFPSGELQAVVGEALADVLTCPHLKEEFNKPKLWQAKKETEHGERKHG